MRGWTSAKMNIAHTHRTSQSHSTSSYCTILAQRDLEIEADKPTTPFFFNSNTQAFQLLNLKMRALEESKITGGQNVLKGVYVSVLNVWYMSMESERSVPCVGCCSQCAMVRVDLKEELIESVLQNPSHTGCMHLHHSTASLYVRWFSIRC